MGDKVTDREINDAKSRDLASIIGATVKLKRRGNEFWGCCPFHKEKSPSFKVEDGRYICFGCGKKGDAIAWAMEAEHLNFQEAVRKLALSSAPVRFAGIIANNKPREYDDRAAKRKALAHWDAGVPIKGTHAERYLRARKVKGPISGELRYLAECVDSDTKMKWPAMVARLTDNSGFACIQRTYLDHLEPKKAPIANPKRTKGKMGGSAVRLREPSLDVLGLAEGIETAMSAAMLYQVPVWATLSAHRLSAIELPETIRNVIIFADAGKVGREEAYKAEHIYEEKGLYVEVVMPGADFGDAEDYNDAAVRAQP